ncbi:hypothetical protein DsansV1_C38g0233161 [Dioscorea sansibarensis]
MAGGNFLGRLVGYVVNEIVVEGLANKWPWRWRTYLQFMKLCFNTVFLY